MASHEQIDVLMSDDCEVGLEDRRMPLTITFHQSLSEAQVRDMKQQLQTWATEPPMLQRLSISATKGPILYFKSPTPFPFLKLPAELRLRVYEYIFVHSEDQILVKRERGGLTVKSYTPSKVKRAAKVTNLSVGCENPSMDTNLLLSCVQVNREASKVLYTSNEFYAPDMGDLYTFLLQIRQSKQWISSVDIGIYQVTAAQRTFDILSESICLKRLAWKFLSSEQQADAGRFLNDARLLLSRVQEIQKGETPWSIIQRTIHSYPQFVGGVQVTQKRQEKNYTRFMRALKKEWSKPSKSVRSLENERLPVKMITRCLAKDSAVNSSFN